MAADKLFTFAKRSGTLKDICEILDTYSLNEIQILINEKEFDIELYNSLSNYLVTRFRNYGNIR